MKLPWDRNWFKGCFYVVATFIMIYVIKLGIDMVAYTLVNASGIADTVTRLFKRGASILAPILVALAAAYVLKPPVQFIKDRVKSRRLACIIVFLMITLPLVVFLIVLLFRLNRVGNGSIADGISAFMTESGKRLDIAYMHLTDFIKRAGLDNVLMPFIEGFIDRGDSLLSYESRIVRLTATVIANIALGMVMAFYLLVAEKPFAGVREILHTLLPEWLYNKGRIILDDIDAVFSGYIRGQLTDGLIMSVLISVALWILGIPFALLIGIISGFSNIIPYFGSITGFVLTAFSAVVSGDYAKAIYGMGAMLVLQQIDSAVIVPRIVGKRVEISPFGVIAALTVGGKLFGLWGMVFAVPVTAVCKVILLRICSRKKGSA